VNNENEEDHTTVYVVRRTVDQKITIRA
jgi:hypothetical protein